ncbi:metal-sulfur cluster assembly factor [Rhodobacter sp. 24-YEA-8]|uniref:metal-sulfur cluster assembly factor n=1 Tax=Rhodobacter sp. 24-YEA-8 TaxID=1884310 RepID=UPI000894EBFE|nr:iron-sulfur cluster assembly protein [Rhodobacter sp. 24-YEA-8]SED47903.1 Metal-sulfur cluster biosynthetic enzyme [Rhodobacter sp. 24-YEA-8]
MNDYVSRVEAELDLVVDPCSAGIGMPVGLVSMGLIKKLTLKDSPEGIDVHILLRLTSPCCMMAPSFATQAEERLTAMQGIRSVEVEIDPAIDWVPSMMRQSYRDTLSQPAFMRGIQSL